jgi:hypothetical protein
MKEIKEKTKQINLEAEINAIEEKIKNGIDGTIKEVISMTNEEFYGTSAYEKRNGVCITVLLDNDVEVKEWFNIEIDERGYQNSNIFAFKNMYKSVPKVGMKIKSILEDGFFRIKI